MRLVTWIGALLTALCAATAFAQTDAETDYRLEVGDSIAISVLEDPSLNTTVLIRPDGKFSMPLAGTIVAEGRTPESVQAAIRRALARDFLEPPTVTVALVGLGGGDQVATRIFVLGQVARPGALEIEPERPINVLQALSLSGGAGAFAATDRIQIRRRENGGDVVLLFDYDQIEDGAAPVNAIMLRDGDVIVVPERGLFE